MKVVIDIEANGLESPTQIWCIICKDINTGKFYIFRNVTTDVSERNRFLEFSVSVDHWIGHNLLGYDYPVLFRLLNFKRPDIAGTSTDTLIISKLVDYPRQGHSLEDYGVEFGYPKGDNSTAAFFSRYSKELEEYCIRDVEITHKVYDKYKRYINDPKRARAIALEHRFQLIVNDLHDNGFSFNVEKARKLLDNVNGELSTLDKDILAAFPPRLKLVREIHPKVTKHGTLSRSDFRWVKDGDLSEFNGGPFCRCSWVDFNPSSHRQLVDVLHGAGWSPVNRTKTHIDLERAANRLKNQRGKSNTVDLELKEIYTKLSGLEKYGWKIDETNLNTLPDNAPSPARLLAKRILLESRRRTLTEWLGLVKDDGRIHGKFYGIGAWTHRMAHQNPNTANIPTDAKLYGYEMRALWRAPRNRLLVGVDAEGIQLRIFAHYINDAEFTESLVKGKKDDKTDPHSLNQRILGAKSRNHAKRFIFAYLLGGGVDKLAQILEMSREEGEAALNRLVERYSGLATLKQSIIPADAKRGWFVGIDGRAVKIPGDTVGQRKHLCMSGYLQNGEAVVMKAAAIRWYEKLDALKLEHERLRWLLVDMVHDEWQTEVNNDIELAKKVAELQAKSLTEVGEELKLNCPLAGSYWNDDAKDFTIGTNWSQTH